jgi:hypothetical protein
MATMPPNLLIDAITRRMAQAMMRPNQAPEPRSNSLKNSMKSPGIYSSPKPSDHQANRYHPDEEPRHHETVFLLSDFIHYEGREDDHDY